MSVSLHANIAAKLDELVNQLKSANLNQERKPRGRPNRGIRRGFVRLEIYLAPDQVAAIDAIAASRVTQTGRRASRTHVFREAVAWYLRAHSPENGG